MIKKFVAIKSIQDMSMMLLKEVFMIYSVGVGLLLITEDIKYGFVSFYIKTNYLIFVWGILFVAFVIMWDKKKNGDSQQP